MISLYDFKFLNFCNFILLVFLNALAWTRCNFGSIVVAFFKFLATFKDCQIFKDGNKHLGGLIKFPSIKIVSGLRRLNSQLDIELLLPFGHCPLDYTSNALFRAIWEKTASCSAILAILWPRTTSNNRHLNRILFIIILLTELDAFNRICGVNLVD